MKSLIASVDRAFTIIESAFFYLSVVVLLTIVVITCLDVGMRYLVHSPLVWSYPLTNTFLMPALFMFALSTCSRYHDHISMDVVRLRMPRGMRRASEVISDLAGFAVTLLVAVFAVLPLVEAWVDDERMPGENWALWPSYLIVPIGFGLLAIRFLIQAADAFTRADAGDVDVDLMRTEGLE